MGSLYDLQFSSVQSLSHVWLFATPWTAAHQASLSITNSWSLLKFMTIQSVTPSNHLILSPPSPPAFNLSHHQGLFKWNGYIFPFLLCFSLLFFSQLFIRPPQRPTILPFCIFFLITASCTVSWTSVCSSSGTLSIRSIWPFCALITLFTVLEGTVGSRREASWGLGQGWKTQSLPVTVASP